VTAAAPKIADYPFTTAVTQSRRVTIGQPGSGDEFSFVLADIPGLIEGADRVSVSGTNFCATSNAPACSYTCLMAQRQSDLWQNFKPSTRNCVSMMSAWQLAHRSSYSTKLDLPEAQERWPALKAKVEAAGILAFAISAVTHQVPVNLCSMPPSACRRLEEAERALPGHLRCGGACNASEARRCFSITREKGVYIVKENASSEQ